jgi:hypothetical protein
MKVLFVGTMDVKQQQTSHACTSRFYRYQQSFLQQVHMGGLHLHMSLHFDRGCHIILMDSRPECKVASIREFATYGARL